MIDFMECFLFAQPLSILLWFSEMQYIKKLFCLLSSMAPYCLRLVSELESLTE